MKERERDCLGCTKRNNTSNEMKLSKRKLRLNIKEEFANSEALLYCHTASQGKRFELHCLGHLKQAWTGSIQGNIVGNEPALAGESR